MQQWDSGAMVYMREAVQALREQRDKHGNPSDKYDRLRVVASNLRDAFEWLYPLAWKDDREFVPFAQRTQGNDWGRAVPKGDTP